MHTMHKSHNVYSMYLSKHSLVEFREVAIIQSIGYISSPVGLTASYHHLTRPFQYPLCTGYLHGVGENDTPIDVTYLHSETSMK